MLGLIIPGIALSWTGRLALVLAPLFSVVAGIAGFTIAYRIQKPRRQGRQLSDDWPGYGFMVGMLGATVGFIVVLVFAMAGIVNNEAWFVFGVLGGALLGGLLYFSVAALVKRA
jgi:uncharacterized membrane protein YdcZ (DUF606 family)